MHVELDGVELWAVRLILIGFMVAVVAAVPIRAFQTEHWYRFPFLWLGFVGMTLIAVTLLPAIACSYYGYFFLAGGVACVAGWPVIWLAKSGKLVDPPRRQ